MRSAYLVSFYFFVKVSLMQYLLNFFYIIKEKYIIIIKSTNKMKMRHVKMENQK